MRDESNEADIHTVSWDDGPGFIIQAYTHPEYPPHHESLILKIKRYTREAYYGAAESGHHHMLYDKRLPLGTTRSQVLDILRRFGCPESKLPKRQKSFG